MDAPSPLDAAAPVDAAAPEDAAVPPDVRGEAAPDALAPSEGGAAPTTDAGGAPASSFPLECAPGASHGEDFSASPTSRFRQAAGQWQWDGANGIYRAVAGAPHALAWIGPRPAWRSYAVEARVRLDRVAAAGGSAGLVLRAKTDGLVDPGGVAPNNAGEMYYVGLHTNLVVLGRMANAWIHLAQAPRTVPTNTWVRLKVEANGYFLRVSVDGQPVLGFVDAAVLAGGVGLRTWEASASFDDLRVTCLPPLEASFRLDENAGTSARDESGLATAELSGGAAWAPGVSGAGVSFTGAGAVRLPGPALVTSDSFSVSAWVKHAADGNFNVGADHQTAVSQEGPQISGFFLKKEPAGRFSFVLPAADAPTFTGGAAVGQTVAAPETWYHVVGVRDAARGELRLYVDGKLEATTPHAAAWDATGPTVFGQARFNKLAVDQLRGVMDSVRLVPRVLTPAEIEALRAAR